VFYGVERTTDLRYPETVVKKFSSLKAALAWKAKDTGCAWSAAADKTLPIAQQNWHNRHRSVYRMPPDWRPPSKKELSRRAAMTRGSMYSRNTCDELASAVHVDGEEVENAAS